MTYDDFDITFCKGELQYAENGTEVIMACPVKERCHRYWSKETQKEADRLGMRYLSFFLLTDPNLITDKGCESFWEEKK